MVWLERIKNRQVLQTQFQIEAQRKLQEEHERQRLARIEKIKPLLKALEDLECRKALTGIRDEIWQLGEVTVSPDLSEVTHESPIEACVNLSAKWSFWGVEPGSGTADHDGCNTVLNTGVYLKIVASYKETVESPEASQGQAKIIVEVRHNHQKHNYISCTDEPFNRTVVDENTPKWLEDRLTDDCLERQNRLPYSAVVKNAQAEIDIHLKHFPR